MFLETKNLSESGVVESSKFCVIDLNGSDHSSLGSKTTDNMSLILLKQNQGTRVTHRRQTAVVIALKERRILQTVRKASFRALMLMVHTSVDLHVLQKSRPSIWSVSKTVVMVMLIKQLKTQIPSLRTLLGLKGNSTRNATHKGTQQKSPRTARYHRFAFELLGPSYS